MTPKPLEGFMGLRAGIRQRMAQVQEENSDLRARVAEAEAKQALDQRQCDDMTEQAGKLAARVAELEREMEKEVELRMHSLRIGLEAARREAKKIADLEQQVAALADALECMTRSVSRCYEHNDDLGDAMDRAKNALRAAGRKT